MKENEKSMKNVKMKEEMKIMKRRRNHENERNGKK